MINLSLPFTITVPLFVTWDEWLSLVCRIPRVWVWGPKFWSQKELRFLLGTGTDLEAQFEDTGLESEASAAFYYGMVLRFKAKSYTYFPLFLHTMLFRVGK